MKTNELSGAALDWAVAKAEGMHVTMVRGGWFVFDSDAYSEFRNDYNDDKLQAFRPSTNWAQGGAIIEREGIAVDCERSSGRVSGWVACNEVAGDDNWDANVHYGTTPLEAAMRCYVTSKLGDEVELPEELNGQV